MPERYVALMKRILKEYSDVLVLITGASTEREEAEGLKREVGSERCINFAGRVKFGELTQLYSVSTLMVSNDSGPGHFSSVTNMPTFVLFGPETPALYGSLGNTTPIYAGLACSPCVSAANHRKTPCVDNVCLQVITVDQVFDTIRPTLEGRLSRGQEKIFQRKGAMGTRDKILFATRRPQRLLRTPRGKKDDHYR